MQLLVHSTQQALYGTVHTRRLVGRIDLLLTATKVLLCAVWHSDDVAQVHTVRAVIHLSPDICRPLETQSRQIPETMHARPRNYRKHDSTVTLSATSRASGKPGTDEAMALPTL